MSDGSASAGAGGGGPSIDGPPRDLPRGIPDGMWTRLGPAPWLTAVLVTVADQVTKLVMVMWLGSGEVVTVIPNLFRLVLVHNRGAAWGMFANATWLLTLISAAALAVLVWRFRQLCEGCWERGMALSVLIGGVAGNFIDRAFRQEVVDFLSFAYEAEQWRFEWPAFNLADSAICVGIGTYLVSSFLRPQPQE